VFFAKELGYEILARSGINDRLADVLLYGGSLLDFALGVWIISEKRNYLCCVMQILVILIYSILLTIIEPAFWLHPFGPLTKNAPILVLILFVMNFRKRGADGQS